MAHGDQIINIASHDGVDGGLKLNNILVKASATELNLLDGVQSGVVKEDTAVIYGSNGEINATKLQIAGDSITATASEIDILDGVTASTAKLILVDGSSAGNVNSGKAVVYGDGGEVNAKLQIAGDSITSTQLK